MAQFTIEDFGTQLIFSYRLRAVLFLSIVALAIYQYRTAQIREVLGLCPHVVMAILVWLPDFWARGILST
ncbi:unnamed protein product [Zymoseptoria tritici ST99CH_1A5]|uniref:Uncharacterized protein n=1 Tax=Zymoseptoria tritici ST99CH_1A5 TaxID=1276529 RepID=A0A1Y6LDB2_ZYMTR|nr:unnamed protein product [Zymoseptoria tritici ST99CH_1A5]